MLRRAALRRRAPFRAFPTGGLSLDVGGYGPWNVEAAYLDGDKVVAVTHQEVGISAREYNLAPLSASFPVVLFSLSYWDIQTAADRHNHSTVVHARPPPRRTTGMRAAEGMYSMPLLKQGSTPDVNDYQIFADYVGELYRLNPQAHFTSTSTTSPAPTIHEIIYANRIPEGSYRSPCCPTVQVPTASPTKRLLCHDPQAKQDDARLAQWNEAKAMPMQRVPSLRAMATTSIGTPCMPCLHASRVQSGG